VTFVSDERLVAIALDALEQILALSAADCISRTRPIVASQNISERCRF